MADGGDGCACDIFDATKTCIDNPEPSLSVAIDLHTHSYGSPDGGLTGTQYKRMLESGGLDCVAITDHGNVAVALQIKTELGKLGDCVIVGEEIKTTDGEIIGLYLSNDIAEGQTPAETVAAIRDQGGLVYIPHPFETHRSGISSKGLRTIIDDVDIIETYNGRAVFQDMGKNARGWAVSYDRVSAASSDAHGWRGWGRTYSIVIAQPTKATLLDLLKESTMETNRVGLIGILYPKVHRIVRRFQRQSI